MFILKLLSIILLITIISVQGSDKETTFNGNKILITTYFGTKPEEIIDLCASFNMELITFNNDDEKLIYQDLLQENRLALAYARMGVDGVPRKYGNPKHLTREGRIPFVICVENSSDIFNAQVTTEHNDE